MKDINLVGIGDDGCMGLSSRAYNAVIESDLLIGGERQLAFFPDFRGRRLILKSAVKQCLVEAIADANGSTITILASGDPMFYGIGSLVKQLVDWERVNVIAQPSSLQLALSRIGRPVQDAIAISLHGRPLHGLVSRLRDQRLAVILTDKENTPQRIAEHLMRFHQADHWRLWVCENLGSIEERITSASLPSMASTPAFSPLNVCVLERLDTNWQPPARIGNVAEECFAKKMPKNGLITKSEHRQLALAKLQISRQSIVWDIGAGSGSVAIEASWLATEGSVFAIECDPECQEFCEENRLKFSCDNLDVICGYAPDCLDSLPDPNCIFVGGSRGSMRAIFEESWRRLLPGGRLVINTVSLENTNEVFQIAKNAQLALDLCLLNVSRGKPLAGGRYLRYDALNPIHIFTFEKPVGGLSVPRT